MSEREKTAGMEHRNMEIDLSPEIATGSYANLAIISHSTTEFILDFASILPGMPKPKVSNRIILTPEHAKRLLGSLQDNIAKYESNNGTIGHNDPTQSLDPFEILNSAPTVGEA